MLNFQDMISKLTQFWVNQGCIAHQGYDLEVGAGTFNPATFLRALGPEPYSAVYVEPSRRPQDGRYGENPNRLQHYHQMQVILKPSPSNILESYIQSLEALGLNLKEHDIRFVHDDWENPTIGAAGLGWEIWLNGMEITQFTYFQIIGGLPVKPVCGEITYGLERIAMYLQNVNSIFDIKWNDQVTYGEIFKHSEWEWSHYNFQEASIEMWRRHFDDFEKEAKALLSSSFPIPAYDFIMKASHAFNILEARGVISVTERTGFITRIRNLAKELAEHYINLRKNLNFPLLKETTSFSTKETPLPYFSYPQEKAPFLLEIGSEELPHSFVPIGMANLEKGIRHLLSENHLDHGKIHTFGTPRRLALIIEDLKSRSEAKKFEKKGPALSLAFNEEGAPTQIGTAFFRSLGLSSFSLEEIKIGKSPVSIRTIKEIPYLFVTIEELSKETMEILSKNLPKVIAEMNFPKKMRWDQFDFEYPRPLRWIVSLYGEEIVDFSIADVSSNRISFGHRQIDPGPISLSSALEYVTKLRSHHVLVDCEERKMMILKELRQLEKSKNVSIVSEAKVLPIVLHLVEWPFILEGHFDPLYLKAPKEVLISEMVEHQKYFPLQHIHDSSLAPSFVIVANNYPSDKIREGNEKALIPRLCDGLFLYEEDVKYPLDSFNEKLKTLTFQNELGSVFAKVQRISQIAKILHFYLPICDLESLLRATLLSKADLTTELVKEFPELQGTIGFHYATIKNEDSKVALAILEHWMPLGEQGSLPTSPMGILLSLADKIDNFLSFFSLGLVPTSSSDPYALRRQALGIIKMLIENRLSLPLQEILDKSFEIFLENPEMDENTRKKIIPQKKEILFAIEEFLKARLRTIFSDLHFPKDEIESVLSKRVKNIFSSFTLLQALHNFRNQKHSAFCKILTVYTRVKKILTSQKSPSLSAPNINLFVESAEKNLFTKLMEIEKGFGESYEKAFDLLAQVEPFLANLFDEVTIIDQDEKLKNNRLSLLQKVLLHCEELVDFGKIQEHSP